MTNRTEPISGGDIVMVNYALLSLRTMREVIERSLHLLGSVTNTKLRRNVDDIVVVIEWCYVLCFDRVQGAMIIGAVEPVENDLVGLNVTIW